MGSGTDPDHEFLGRDHHYDNPRPLQGIPVTPVTYIPDKYEDLHHKVSEAAKGTKEAIGNEISKIDDKIRSLNERLAGLHLAYQKVVTEFGEWL